jgi:hypothetical protein
MHNLCERRCNESSDYDAGDRACESSSQAGSTDICRGGRVGGSCDYTTSNGRARCSRGGLADEELGREACSRSVGRRRSDGDCLSNSVGREDNVVIC